MGVGGKKKSNTYTHTRSPQKKKKKLLSVSCKPRTEAFLEAKLNPECLSCILDGGDECPGLLRAGEILHCRSDSEQIPHGATKFPVEIT